MARKHVTKHVKYKPSFGKAYKVYSGQKEVDRLNDEIIRLFDEMTDWINPTTCKDKLIKEQLEILRWHKIWAEREAAGRPVY